MDVHALIYLILGLAFFGLNWLPELQQRRFQKLPVHFFYIVVGIAFFQFLLPSHLPRPLTDKVHGKILEYATELIVILSLMTCGIALDKALSFSKWRVPILLIAITMPLTMFAIGLAGSVILGLSLAQACLLAACLAPTDPVLARGVQVGPPNEGGESADRFSLTAEAGMNDGMAFPFVYLSLAIAASGLDSEMLLTWTAYDLFYRIAAGVIAGVVVGRVMAYYIFRRSNISEDDDSDAGLIVMSGVFLSYGITELINGYGFLAVFCAAVAGRSYEKGHDFHKKPYHFLKQTEDLTLGFLLLIVGGMVITFWDDILRWESLLSAMLVLFVIRPISALIGVGLLRISRHKKLVISFFGIRGMGSLYYLSFGHNQLDEGTPSLLWGAVLATIVLSILIHGATAGMAIPAGKANPETAKT